MHTLIKPLTISLILLLLLSFPVFAEASPPDPLSPALSVIKDEYVLCKSAVCGEEISFTAGDFEDLLGIGKCGQIMITSLPPVTHGQLALGQVQVIKNQVIPRRQIGKLRFLPNTSEPCDCSFTFRAVGSEEYEMTCVLRTLKEENCAPTVSAVDESRLNVTTFENVTGFFSLTADDPENDELRYEIVRYPKRGILALTDPTLGQYTYTPILDYVGSDSFTYTVSDGCGNRTEEITVSVRIEENASSLVYADLIGKDAQYAAIRLTEARVLEPQYENGSAVFCPERGVSRLDFLLAAMKATGHRISTTVTKTGFEDDAQIPSESKGYVAAAVSLGYVSGIEEDGGTYFRPVREISRAEAAVILSRIVPLPKPVLCPVYADQSSVPAWARDAVDALSRIGALDLSPDGRLSPDRPLTRAECARMLCAVMEYPGK